MSYASRVDDVAAAVADPVRRSILEMLRAEPLAARRIAARFPISRPAVSRHLRVLRECGLVRDTLVGRERLYALDATRLAGLRDWLDAFLPPVPAAASPAAAPAAAASPAAASTAAQAAGQARADMWHQRLDSLRIEVHRTRRDRASDGAGTAPQEEIA